MAKPTKYNTLKEFAAAIESEHRGHLPATPEDQAEMLGHFFEGLIGAGETIRSALDQLHEAEAERELRKQQSLARAIAGELTRQSPPQSKSKLKQSNDLLPAEINGLRGSGAWIADELRRMKTDGDIPNNVKISHLARELEKRMRKANRADASVRPLKWQSIKNQLPYWGLWPVDPM